MEENKTYDHLALLTRKAQSKAGKRYHYGHTLDIKLLRIKTGQIRTATEGGAVTEISFATQTLSFYMFITLM